MTNGTLSETRTTPEVQATIKTTAVEVVENPPIIDKEPIVISPTVVEQREPTAEPPTQHLQNSSCAYCKAEAITTLAIRTGFVVLLFALSFNLFKSTKK